jgi:hypothetical protein
MAVVVARNEPLVSSKKLPLSDSILAPRPVER